MLEEALHSSPTNKKIFTGEVSNDEFVSYAGVAALSGITVGGIINEGAGWLNFNLDGKDLMVAKKPVRLAVSWKQLDAAGCVYGNKTISINDKQYKVRLLTGLNSSPMRVFNGYYHPDTRESEWDRLFYPIVNDDTNIPIPPRDIAAPYTEADLGMETGGENRSWCQDIGIKNNGEVSARFHRGRVNCSFVSSDDVAASSNFYKWRPCLELVH